MAMFEEVHLFGHADAGTNRFVETLVDDNREAHRLFAVLDLDFDVDFKHLKSTARIGRSASRVLRVLGWGCDFP